jgi:hypothetical protein
MITKSGGESTTVLNDGRGEGAGSLQLVFAKSLPTMHRRGQSSTWSTFHEKHRPPSAPACWDEGRGAAVRGPILAQKRPGETLFAHPLNRSFRLEKSRVDDGPQMNDPSQQHNPKDRSEHKVHQRHQDPALDQLTEPGNEEAGQSGDHVSCRTLSSHTFSLPSLRLAGNPRSLGESRPGTWWRTGPGSSSGRAKRGASSRPSQFSLLRGSFWINYRPL